MPLHSMASQLAAPATGTTFDSTLQTAVKVALEAFKLSEAGENMIADVMQALRDEAAEDMRVFWDAQKQADKRASADTRASWDAQDKKDAEDVRARLDATIKKDAEDGEDWRALRDKERAEDRRASRHAQDTMKARLDALFKKHAEDVRARSDAQAKKDAEWNAETKRLLANVREQLDAEQARIVKTEGMYERVRSGVGDLERWIAFEDTDAFARIQARDASRAGASSAGSGDELPS